MLYICHGARGSGKTTLLKELSASGVEVVGPPVWETFDKFAADPYRYALRNQQEALRANVAVIRSGFAKQRPCVTDASLLRFRLFSETLRSLGYLTARDCALLTAEDRSLTSSIDEGSIIIFHLMCREEVRLLRMSARGDPADANEKLDSIQLQADYDQICQSAQLVQSEEHILIETNGETSLSVQEIIQHMRVNELC